MPNPNQLAAEPLVQRNFLMPETTAEALREHAHRLRVPQAVLVRYGIALVLAELDGTSVPERDF